MLSGARRRMAESEDRKALAYHVRRYVPDCKDGDEMERRISLLIARDYAVSLLSKTRSEAATDHAISARETADAFCFAGVSVDRLDMAVNYCRKMVQCAFIADALEGEQ